MGFRHPRAPTLDGTPGGNPPSPNVTRPSVATLIDVVSDGVPDRSLPDRSLPDYSVPDYSVPGSKSSTK